MEKTQCAMGDVLLWMTARDGGMLDIAYQQPFGHGGTNPR
jgi:hypothetical protein